MTAHVRTQIRDKFVDLLDSLTTTGSRCYGARPGTRKLQDADLPCLVVYTNDESVEPIARLTAGSRRMQRLLDVQVRGYVKGTGDIDASLDTIAAEVETVIGADPTLAGLAKDCYLQSVAKEDDDEVEQPTWRITLSFSCEYNTAESAPTAALA